MKKILALILISSMMAVMLTGCGNNNATSTDKSTEVQGSESQSANENGEESSEKAAVENGEIYEVIMQWPSYGDSPPGLADVEDAINEIIEAEIGVRLKLEPVLVTNLLNETALKVSSGEKLDLCLALNTGVGPYVNNGSIIPLDTLAADYGKDIMEICGNSLAGGYYNKILYGIPCAYINGEEYGYAARTDLLEKYGYEIDPDTYYDLEFMEELFATVKAGEGENFFMVAGGANSDMAFESSTPYDKLGATKASGVLPLWKSWEDTEIVNLFASDYYAAYAQRMYDWAQKRYLSSDMATTSESRVGLVASGNYLGCFAGNISGGKMAEADYSNQTGMDMTLIRLVEPYSAMNMFQNVLWCIPATCENPEKTMQFFNYLYIDNRISNLLAYGIEGVSYVVVERGEDNSVIALPEGFTIDNLPYYSRFGVYGNRLNQHVKSPGTLTSLKELRDWSENITRKSPALGYCFISDSVSAEYSAVTAVIVQYQAIISAGGANPEEQLPRFLADLEAAGINKVIEENQRQLDKWLADQ